MSEHRTAVLIVALLAIMVISGALGARHRAGPVLLALASIVWLLVDASYEGRTLWAVTSTHGLTSSDLVGVLGLLVAAVQLWRLRH